MLNFLSKTTTMSIDEFLQLERGQITLKEIRKKHNLEIFTAKIMKSDRFKKFAITLLGCSLYFKNVFAAGKGIDALGWTILGLIRQWGYWILLIACTVEIVRAGTGSDSKKILSIVMKFLLIFALMYIVPEGFNAIKNSF